MNTRAFTLIELMISLTLGMLIIYVAISGFRVAVQSISITHRMAIENDLLRTGCLVANERLDFWTDFDDPDNPAEQRLRVPVPNGPAGLPFTPMSAVFPLVGNADPEKTTGWDPQEPWRAADPRTWWHGSVAQKYDSEMALGRYSIFSNLNSSVNITTLGGYGQVTVLRQWLNGQIHGLSNAIGYYGFADYLPQNTLFAYYTTASGSTNADGMPHLLMNSGSFFNNEGNQRYVKGLWRLTMGSAYAVASPTYSNANQAATHRKLYRVSYTGSSTGTMNTFFNETENNRPLLAASPTHWPTVKVITQHFIKTNRFVNLAQVEVLDPISGASTALTFTSFATTLRGARQQRRHPSDGGGWVDYDNRVGWTSPLTLDDTP